MWDPCRHLKKTQEQEGRRERWRERCRKEEEVMKVEGRGGELTEEGMREITHVKQEWNALQHTATHCTATHSNTLQHTAIH